MPADRWKKWVVNVGWGLLALALYIGFVWVYFQYEQFSPNRADIGIAEAAWYAVLNPTDLGSTTTKLFPQTLAGRTIGFVFALTSLGLLGVFIGKVSDMFNEFREQVRLGRRPSGLAGHVVILGWDDYSRRVAVELVRSEISVAIITNEKSDIDRIREVFEDDDLVHPVYAGYDNYASLERFCNVSESARVFLNRRADTDTLITLFNIENAFSSADLSYVVRVRNERLLDRFDLEHKEIDVTPVWTFDLASSLVASYVYRPEVAAFGRDLVEAREDGRDYEFQQYRVSSSAPFAGETYNDAFGWFFERGVYLMGVAQTDDGDRETKVLLDGDEGERTTVDADDYVLVVLEAARIQQMEGWSGFTKGLGALAADA